MSIVLTRFFFFNAKISQTELLFGNFHTKGIWSSSKQSFFTHFKMGLQRFLFFVKGNRTSCPQLEKFQLSKKTCKGILNSTLLSTSLSSASKWQLWWLLSGCPDFSDLVFARNTRHGPMVCTPWLAVGLFFDPGKGKPAGCTQTCRWPREGRGPKMSMRPARMDAKWPTQSRGSTKENLFLCLGA